MNDNTVIEMNLIMCDTDRSILSFEVSHNKPDMYIAAINGLMTMLISTRYSRSHEPRLGIILQSYKELQNRNLTDMVLKIPSDVHMYWYTAEFGVSENHFH